MKGVLKKLKSITHTCVYVCRDRQMDVNLPFTLKGCVFRKQVEAQLVSTFLSLHTSNYTDRAFAGVCVYWMNNVVDNDMLDVRVYHMGVLSLCGCRVGKEQQKIRIPLCSWKWMSLCLCLTRWVVLYVLCFRTNLLTCQTLSLILCVVFVTRHLLSAFRNAV